MAIKYIYRQKGNDSLVNFIEMQQDIERIIFDIYGNNLKDVYVYADFFEFTLHTSVEPYLLRLMGKRMKQQLYRSFKLKRAKQEMYAIVTKQHDCIEVEFVDVIVCSDELERRIRLNQEKWYNQDTNEMFDDWVYRLNYLDVYGATFSYDEFNKVFHGIDLLDCEEEQKILLKVNLQHRKVNNIDFSFNQKDTKYFIIEHLFTAAEDYYETYDIASISGIEKIENSNLMQVEQQFVVKNVKQINDLNQLKDVQVKEGFNKDKLLFKVHNVGQGLATSFSNEGEYPFLYFDYGVACRKNKLTSPSNISIPIKSNGVIILSHLHEDHWCGFRINELALSTCWLIPRQKMSITFKKFCGSIIKSGGKIYYYDQFLNITPHIHMNHSDISKQDCHRVPKGVHQTGYAMHINAKSLQANKSCKILICGDQDYDYLEQNYMQELDVLVACHHGGEYSWTSKAKLPSPSPNYERIIYSYGKNNTYNHPSNVKKYELAGWTKRYDTIHGDYEQKICLF